MCFLPSLTQFFRISQGGEGAGGEGEGDHTPDIPINFHPRHFVRAIGTRMHLKSVKMPESFLWEHPPSE